MSITIQSSGPMTTIQDLGRFGVMKNGFTQSGAMDSKSAAVANILVGNDKSKAVLEMTLMGITGVFDRECLIALSGADFSSTLNGVPIVTNKAYKVNNGDVLKMGYAKNGVRAYLAVSGGIKADNFMGSMSTNMKSAVGGFHGRKLAAGDIVETFVNDISNIDLLNRETEPFVYSDNITVRAVLGPQDDMFTSEDINTFFTASYTVTPQADRMGIRLDGTPLKSKSGFDIISDGIVFGSVQVPKSGMPIILMADHQTTGGYAKIATVISTDLPLLAQAKPGSKVHFEKVDVKTAEKIAKQNAKELSKMLKF